MYSNKPFHSCFHSVVFNPRPWQHLHFSLQNPHCKAQTEISWLNTQRVGLQGHSCSLYSVFRIFLFRFKPIYFFVVTSYVSFSSLSIHMHCVTHTVFLAYPPFLREKNILVRSPCCLWRVSVPLFQLLNQLTDSKEIWYGCYTTGSHPNLILFNFLQSVITWCMHKLLRWEWH